MKTMKSRLRLPDGSFKEITAKAEEPKAVTQEQKDKAVAAEFEAALKKREGGGKSAPDEK